MLLKINTNANQYTVHEVMMTLLSTHVFLIYFNHSVSVHFPLVIRTTMGICMFCSWC